MITTLNTCEIANLLLRDDYASWSYAGALAMAEHLEQIEEDAGFAMEFDRVAIRSDFAEHASLQGWADDQFSDAGQAAGELGLTLALDGESFEEEGDEIDNLIRAYISNNGQLIEFNGGVIVSQF